MPESAKRATQESNANIKWLISELQVITVEYQARAHVALLKSKLPAQVGIPLFVDITRILHKTLAETAEAQGYKTSLTEKRKEAA